MMNALTKLIDNTVPSRMFPAILDDFFSDDFFKPTAWIGREKTSYPMNVIRLTDEKGATTGYRLEYALAGFDKNDIKVHLDGDLLKIDASRPERVANDGEYAEYRGISYRKLSMSYRLMENADREQIKSKFQNGLLAVTIPVKQQSVVDEGHLIEIE